MEDSWEAAKQYAKKYIRKINFHHEVIISFDKRIGDYIGNSLGIALTISFIEELLSFYNAPTIVVSINYGIAFTGGNDAKGNISPVSKEIIEKKLETIFYSDINTFVIPEEDQLNAALKLKELQKDFPERKVKLIGVETFEDILNRRNLVDISKQKTIVRFYKFSKKNWASLILLLILAVVVVISGVLDLDSNPAVLDNEGYMIYVKNKNGKVLWSKKSDIDLINDFKKSEINLSQKIVDINNDGINEVILTDEDLLNTKDENDYLRVACYNNKGNLIWKYNFRDSVLTREGVPERRFKSYLIDTLTVKRTTILYLFTAHSIIYPSVVYRLNLLNGKRLKGTLWSQGHFAGALIGDFNKDGKNELVGAGINNGCERCFILSINLDQLNGQTPTLDNNYYYLNKKIAKFNQYLLLPKSDYNDYFKQRFNIIPRGNFAYQSDLNKFIFSIYEGEAENPDSFCGYTININPALNKFDIFIGDEFHVRRDSLVAKGLLKPPYTNTNAFVNILKNQVRYWNGEKFVKKEELVK